MRTILNLSERPLPGARQPENWTGMKTQLEHWRLVVGYEGLYQVSNWGRVKSLNYLRTRQERILKLAKDNYGYLRVNLYKDGKVTDFRAHRLVGMAFPDLVGWTEDTKGKSFDELQINHKKEGLKEKANNHVSNLEWITLEGNLKYGTHNERAAKAMSKRVAQKTKDGELVKIWLSAREVQRQLGWNQSHISKCCNGKLKTYKGFLWEFVL